MQDFRNLKVWQKAHEFVLAIYPATGDFPQHELFGLRTQLRRSSVAIPSHIAEGCGLSSDTEFARCIYKSIASTSEVEYLILLAKDLVVINQDKYTKLANDVIELKRMLSGLLGSLSR